MNTRGPITVEDLRDMGPNEYRQSHTGMEGRKVTLITREGKLLFLLFDRDVIRACLDCITAAGTIRFSVSTGRWTDGPAPEILAPMDLAPILGQRLRALKFYTNRMQIEFDRHRVIIASSGFIYCFPHVFSQETVH